MNWTACGWSIVSPVSKVRNPPRRHSLLRGESGHGMANQGPDVAASGSQIADRVVRGPGAVRGGCRARARPGERVLDLDQCFRDSLPRGFDTGFQPGPIAEKRGCLTVAGQGP